MLDYISANASIFNEFSIGEALAYLLSAIEIEKQGSPWFVMSMKAFADCLFVKAFEAYSMEKGVCLSEAVSQMYQKFTNTEIPVNLYYPEFQGNCTALKTQGQAD